MSKGYRIGFCNGVFYFWCVQIFYRIKVFRKFSTISRVIMFVHFILINKITRLRYTFVRWVFITVVHVFFLFFSPVKFDCRRNDYLCLFFIIFFFQSENVARKIFGLQCVRVLSFILSTRIERKNTHRSFSSAEVTFIDISYYMDDTDGTLIPQYKTVLFRNSQHFEQIILSA